MPGGHDARTLDPPLVDRRAERHVEQISAGLDHESQVAHRRETGLQGQLAVADAHQRSQRGVDLHTVHRVPRLVPVADQHVQFHVHQAGQQGDITERDLRGPLRHVGRADRLDEVIANHDHGRRADLAGIRRDVEPTIGTQDDHVTRGVLLCRHVPSFTRVVWGMGISRAPTIARLH